MARSKDKYREDSASDKLPSPLESTHCKDNHEEETENRIDSTARRLFKRVSQSPSPAAIAVEGTLFIFIATATARSVELYGDRYEAGEKGGDYLSPRMSLCFWNKGIMGY